MKKSILRRTVRIILFSFLILLGSIFGVMYYTSVNAMKKHTMATAESNLEMMRTYLDMTIEQLTNSMYLYAQNDVLSGGDKDKINEFFRAYSGLDTNIDCIMLMDREEVLAISKPVLMINRSIDTAQYYGMAQTNRLVLSAPYYSVPLGSRVISLIRSITDAETGNEYLLAAEIRPQNLFSPFSAKLSKGETLVVMTAQGSTVYLDYTSPLLGGLVNHNNQLDLSETLRSRLKGLRTGITEIESGGKKLVVRRLRYNQDWSLYILADLSQFYGALNEMLHVFRLVGIVSIFVLVFISYGISRGIVRPVRKLARQVDSLSPEDKTLQLSAWHNDEVGRLAASFNRLLERLQKSNKENMEMEREHFRLEYKVLQSQIQPHFLFNTHMCVVALLERGDTENARRMLRALDSLLRTSTDKIGEIITLREELEAVKQYSTLQQIRLGNTFDIVIEGWEAFAEVKVPKLLLQPIVENAIYHGLAEINRRGEIRIQCFEIDGQLHMVIEDNGCGMPQEMLNSITDKEPVDETARHGMVSIGIANVRQRIKSFYGQDCGLYILSRENIGTTVEIVVNINL